MQWELFLLRLIQNTLTYFLKLWLHVQFLHAFNACKNCTCNHGFIIIISSQQKRWKWTSILGWMQKNRSCALVQIKSPLCTSSMTSHWNGISHVCVNCIDYEKAFESVDMRYLWKLLRHCTRNTRIDYQHHSEFFRMIDVQCGAQRPAH